MYGENFKRGTFTHNWLSPPPQWDSTCLNQNPWAGGFQYESGQIGTSAVPQGLPVSIPGLLSASRCSSSGQVARCWLQREREALGVNGGHKEKMAAKGKEMFSNRSNAWAWLLLGVWMWFGGVVWYWCYVGSQLAVWICLQSHNSGPETQRRKVPGLWSVNQGSALLAGVCRGFCGYFETFLTINILCFDTGNFTLLETRDCHLVRPHPP